MLGLHRLSALFGAAPLQDPDPAPVDPQDIVAYFRQLTVPVEKSGGGLKLLFCHPGTDEPWDLRSKKQVTDAEEVWEELPQDQRPGSRASLAAEGMATDTSVTLSAWLKRALKTAGVAEDLKCGAVDGVPNLACNIGASRVVVVDAETPAAITEFKTWAARLSGDAMWRDPFQAMTVATPSGGGQFWFTLPGDGSRPDDPVITMANNPGHMRITGETASFTLLLHSTCVALPGSQTDAGVWRMIGEAMDAPQWLTQFITAQSASRIAGTQDRYTRLARFGEAPVAWSNATSWDQVLGPSGWHRDGTDRCECPVFTNAEATHRITTHEHGCPVEPSGAQADSGARFWQAPPDGSAPAVLMDKLGRDTLDRLEMAAALYCGADLHAAVNAAWTNPATLTGGVTAPPPAAAEADAERPADQPRDQAATQEVERPAEQAAVQQPAQPSAQGTAPDEPTAEPEPQRAVSWAPAGTVTTISDPDALATLDVEMVSAGPGTGHPLDAQSDTWNALAQTAAGDGVDMIVVPRFDDLAASLGIDPAEAAEWILGNLTALSSGVNVAVTVVRAAG